VSATALLVVTVDGYAKLLDPLEVPLTERGRKGVKLSSVHVAAMLPISLEDEIVIATRTGKVTRIAAADVPMHRRRVQAAGRVSKGARVVTLGEGDHVATADVVQTPRAAPDEPGWPWGMAGLRRGETIAQAAVLSTPIPLEEITPGGLPAVPHDEWAQTAIHNASTYECAHCGREHPDPHAVYLCIDRHVEAELEEGDR
jgi:hypothetical protein